MKRQVAKALRLIAKEAQMSQRRVKRNYCLMGARDKGNLQRALERVWERYAR